MTDYSKMSDKEINKQVAFALGCKEVVPDIFMDDNRRYEFDKPKNKSGNRFYFDPCNNPVDAWPIVIDNKLSLNNYGSSWEASFEHYKPVGAFGTDECVTSGVEDKNPLRALMIAFLMKVETENAKIPSERDS
ncbi:DUF2591 family protein [Klebsiella michiganensis]|uniref:phage protein NinX family protein n=1 Tax=Klebsiella michiganensis TaxID=1134687 RepID=UPI0022546783|nr:phage protein NinX family protein [Klebsiella michiganensis]MCX3078405.1 DUF2591 family protein [Klebsiella michiganensis]MCY0817696.1 DUF2591 family protein [Klebsiella michiganensis]